jgi:hypothetical protein
MALLRRQEQQKADFEGFNVLVLSSIFLFPDTRNLTTETYRFLTSILSNKRP